MPQQKKTTFPENVFPILEKLNDQKIIVACSGGSDSMVLLDLLCKSKVQSAKCKVQNGEINNKKNSSFGILNFEFGINEVIVAHVHHGLRDSADRDEKIVRDYCKKHELEFEILHADIKKEAKKTKTTIEECARNIRKAWLEEIRVKHSANYILTAHHADDQTETILYRLVKGTSITGLTGIQELSGVYFRPFLGAKKKDILAYAKKNKIPFGHDETNDDTSIPRNLLRNEVIPRLENINPEAGIALARLSKNAQELKSGFDEFFKKELESCPLEKGGQGGFFLSFEKYHALPLAFQHELLRYWYEQANGSTHGFSTALVDELDRFLSTRNGGKKEFGKYEIKKRHGTIYLTNNNL